MRVPSAALSASTIVPHFCRMSAMRAGLAEDEGYGPDLEKDEVAEDVGIDGAEASAEEAAVHIVEP